MDYAISELGICRQADGHLLNVLQVDFIVPEPPRSSSSKIEVPRKRRPEDPDDRGFLPRLQSLQTNAVRGVSERVFVCLEPRRNEAAHLYAASHQKTTAVINILPPSSFDPIRHVTQCGFIERSISPKRLRREFFVFLKPGRGTRFVAYLKSSSGEDCAPRHCLFQLLQPRKPLDASN